MFGPGTARLGSRRLMPAFVVLVALMTAAIFVISAPRVSADDGDITLTPGWNLVGWTGADVSIATALEEGGVTDSVSAVWGYSGGGWSAFFPSAADIPGANDLTTFVSGSGYFINISGSANVVWHTGAVGQAPATPTETTTPPATVQSFGDGTQLVGADIQPGTYRTREATEGCYWERLSGLGGTPDEIIANDFTNGVSVVTIAASDTAFSSENCGEWTTDLSAITSSTTAPIDTDGVYLVGVDLAPGTWRATADDGCYWARLSGFSGTFDDIIANDYTDSAPVVAISASDKGFETSGCGVWTRVS